MRRHLGICSVRFLVGAATLAVAACGGTASPSVATDTSPDGTRQVRLLALGDSYTIGEAVSADGRWVDLLVARLAEEGLQVAPEIIARTGWTTDELFAAIDEADPPAPYDLVTLMIGVNDQFRGYDIGGFRHRFATLVGRSLDLAGGDASKVIILTIPDWGVTPFAPPQARDEIALEIDAFNRVVNDEAVARGVTVVDVTPVSRRAAREPGLIAPDGLHPSRAMHEEWAHLVLPLAVEALS